MRGGEDAKGGGGAGTIPCSLAFASGSFTGGSGSEFGGGGGDDDFTAGLTSSGALLGPAPGLEVELEPSGLPGSLGCAADNVDALLGVLGGSEMATEAYARRKAAGPARGGVTAGFRSGAVEQK